MRMLGAVQHFAACILSARHISALHNEHQPWLASHTFYVGKELLLFAFVVMVHGFAPALAVGEEVSGILARYMWRLEVDGVETADNTVVGKSHLSRCIVRSMRGLDSVISLVVK